MITREITWLLLAILATSSIAEDTKTYDTNDWIPIAPQPKDNPEPVPVVERKATGRVLNLAEPPPTNFFPEEPKQGRNINFNQQQQYLRETTNVNPYHQGQRHVQRLKHPYRFEGLPPPPPPPPLRARPPQPQQLKPEQSQQYYVQEPKQQAQLLQPYQEYHTIPEEYLVQQGLVRPNNVQPFYQNLPSIPDLPPIRLNGSTLSQIQTINHELAASNIQQKPIDITTPKQQQQQENIQLVYVPLESLNQKDLPGRLNAYQQVPSQEIPPQFAQPTYAHKQQQIHDIQNDFVRQALEAHKLQVQLEHESPYALPVIAPAPTTTSTTTTRRPPVKKRKPHQPPLAVYMEGHRNVNDVLALLKDAKSIEVQDSVGPDSPKIFVGPSTLDAPDDYAKFELPYLSSLDNNRVERKVDQYPFFVAPLSYKAPLGYSKIPLPSPHVGSVVIKEKLHEKAQTEETPKHSTYIQPQPVQHVSVTPNSQQHYSVTPKYQQQYEPSTVKYDQHVINQYELDQINGFIPQNMQDQPERYLFDSFQGFTVPSQTAASNYNSKDLDDNPYKEPSTTPFSVRHKPTITTLNSQEQYSKEVGVPESDYETNQQTRNTKNKPSYVEQYHKETSYEEEEPRTRPPVHHRGRGSANRGRTNTTPRVNYEENVAPRRRPTTPAPTYVEESYHAPTRSRSTAPPRKQYTHDTTRSSPTPSYEYSRHPATYAESQEQVRYERPNSSEEDYSAKFQGSKYLPEPKPKYTEYEEEKPQQEIQYPFPSPSYEESYHSPTPQPSYASTPKHSVYDEPKKSSTSRYNERESSYSSTPKQSVYDEPRHPPTSRYNERDSSYASTPKQSVYDEPKHPSKSRYNEQDSSYASTPKQSVYDEPKHPPKSRYNEQDSSYASTPKQSVYDEPKHSPTPQYAEPTHSSTPQYAEPKHPSSPQYAEPQHPSTPQYAEPKQPHYSDYEEVKPAKAKPTESTLTHSTQKYTVLEEYHAQHHYSSEEPNGQRPIYSPETKPDVSQNQHLLNQETLDSVILRNQQENYITGPQQIYEQSVLQNEDHQHIYPNLIHNLEDPSVRQLLQPGLVPTSTSTTTEAPETSSAAYIPSTSATPYVEITTTKRTRGRQRVGSRYSTTTESSVAPTRRSSQRGRRPTKTRYQEDSANDYNPIVRSTTDPTKRIVTARSRFRTRGRPTVEERASTTERQIYENTPDFNADDVHITTARNEEPQYVISNYQPVYNVPADQTNVVSLSQKVESNRPVTEPITIHEINQLPIKNLEEHQDATTEKSVRIRPRVRGRTRATTTTTTPAPRTEAAAKGEEFYGFFRAPNFRRTSTEAPATPKQVYSSTYVSSTLRPIIQYPDESVGSNNVKYYTIEEVAPSTQVQFVGEIRPKYASTAEYYETTEESTTKARNRIRLPNKRVETQSELLTRDDSTIQVPQRTRTRGRVHYKVPAKPKDSSEDEDVEGGNYPVQYKTQTVKPSFQITIDPLLEDQVPYSSIYRPTYVAREANSKDEAFVEQKHENVNNLPGDDKPSALPIVSSEETGTENNFYEKFVEEIANLTQSNEEPAVTTTETEITTQKEEELPKATKSRRRGVWRLVKRPADVLEGAESQNIANVKVNSFDTTDKPVKVEIPKIEEEQQEEETTEPFTTSDEQATTATEASFFNSLYEMFGLSKSDNPTQSSNKTQEETTIPVEDDLTTVADEAEEIPTTEIPMTYITPMSLETWNKGVIKTSTSTEISHETEICYKGRCIKSKDMKVPQAKQN